MKTIELILLAVLLAPAISLYGYDLKTRALTPVSFEESPVHAPLTLVENGNLHFSIVTDLKIESRQKNNTEKSIAPAVSVLSEAFEKCTGKKPEIFDITELEKARRKYPYLIVVGDNELVRKNGIDVMKLPEQGFAIKTFEHGIIIAGYDSSLIEGYNLDPLDYRGAATGTKYGAYDFAERFMGIRYFFPGDYGTCWPKADTLTITPVYYTDYPRFNTRGSRYSLWCTVNSEAMLKMWEPYMGRLKQYDTSFGDRWRFGGTMPPGGAHCPTPQALANAYPDKLNTIFYTSPSGKFYYEPKEHTGNYYNVMDLKFADLLIGAIREYYQSGGKTDKGRFAHQVNNTYISFGLCDTYLPESEIIGHPAIHELGLVSNGDRARGEDAFMANVYARFYQYFANRIKEEFPGKKLYILAYYNSRNASLDPRWKLPENVEVNLCDFRLPLKTRNPKAMDDVRQCFREWYQALGARPVQKVWLYSSRVDPFAQALAGEFVGDVPKIMGKYLGRDGSMFLDCLGSDLWYYYYSAYAAHRSQWNPDWDVDAGIDEHWSLFYGPQCGPILQEFHKTLKDMFIRYAVPSEEHVPAYPPETLDRLEKLLKQAESVLAPDTPEMRRFRLFATPWPKNFEMQRARSQYEKPVYSIHRFTSGEDMHAPDTWKKIHPIPLRNPRGDTVSCRFSPEVKLAWDSTGIHGRFKIPYSPMSDMKKSLWQNDNFEMFFLSGVEGEVKHQIAFDAVNQPYFSRQRILPIPQPVDIQWKPAGFLLKNTLSESTWTGEFFIPFHDLVEKTPTAYDCWQFNLVHNKNSDPKEVSGSSLTLGNNHNTTMYGIIKFAGKGDGE